MPAVAVWEDGSGPSGCLRWLRWTRQESAGFENLSRERERRRDLRPRGGPGDPFVYQLTADSFPQRFTGKSC